MLRRPSAVPISNPDSTSNFTFSRIQWQFSQTSDSIFHTSSFLKGDRESPLALLKSGEHGHEIDVKYGVNEILFES